KMKDTASERVEAESGEYSIGEQLADPHDSPFENFAHGEVKEAVEKALHDVPEPFRSALILRDLEEMSYEEIAEVLQVSLGTVKSRITRGRQALRRLLAGYARKVAGEMGLLVPQEDGQSKPEASASGGREAGVTP